MGTFRKLLALIFSELFFKKILAFSLLVFLGYLLREFLALFLITFIFSYLFLETGIMVTNHLHEWWLHAKNSRAKKLALKYSTVNYVVSVLYILFVAIIILIFINIVPKIGSEIENLARSAPKLANAGQDLVIKLENELGLNLGGKEVLANFFNETSIEGMGQRALHYIQSAGVILMKFFMGLVLSFIFIIERDKVSSFFRQMQDGNFSFLYREYSTIATKIRNGFGLIFKAQSIIALTNAIISTLGLFIIGIIVGNGETFPYIFTLSLIVFIFGFIPIFGTILSSIPIVIIGYGFWGFPAVISVVAMVGIVHAVEAYFLNPKIVSSYINFPVFITFIILILSEHFFGLVGLLIGVPLFSILLGFIEDLDRYISEIRVKLHE
jgi:predicted PurR-regulated permease PerM